MVPDRDYYADKNGKLTDDPNEYDRQVAVKGCFLDPRIATRFGIDLISVNEPSAPRRMLGSIPGRRKTEPNEASVKIVKADEKAEEKQEEKKPQEPAEAAELKTDEPKAEKAEAKKPAAKKEKK